MTQTLDPNDGRLTWQGIVSIRRDVDSVMPWRLPEDRLELYPPEGLQKCGSNPAGVRLSFRSDTELVEGDLVPDAESTAVDLYVDGVFQTSAPLGGRSGFSFKGLHAGEKLIELWLPQLGTFRLKSLGLSDGATLSPFEDTRPRWITYGSSISHCGAAESPSQTWPAIVAREHGLDLTCLGYGGNCHMDPMIARMIRDTPADYISIKIGINIHSKASLGPRTFRPAVIGFVETVREKHPDTPFAVVSSIVSPPKEVALNGAKMSMESMRYEASEAVSALQAHGDKNLHYVDGLRILGPEDAHMLPDDVHPDAEGYKFMGRRFLDEVAVPLFKGRSRGSGTFSLALGSWV